MNLLVKNDDVCRVGVCDDVVVDLIPLFLAATATASSAPHRLPATLSNDAVFATLVSIVLYGELVARLRPVQSTDFVSLSQVPNKNQTKP